MHSLASALKPSSDERDVRVAYANPKELVGLCRTLGLMEDLKAGIPRTGYHGVVMVRAAGRRVWLVPSWKVEQEIAAPPPKSASPANARPMQGLN